MTTLRLKDPGSAPYAESSLPGNMLYLNYSSSSSYSDTMAYSSQTQHNSVELPVPTSMLPQESAVGEPDLVASRIGDNLFNAWKDGRNEMFFMQSVGGPPTTTDDLIHSSVTDDLQMGLRTQLGFLNGQNLSLQSSSVSGLQGQGLSLSLSTQIPVSSFHYTPGSDISFVGSHQSTAGNGLPCRPDNARDKRIVETSSYGLSNLAISITNSKYLRAAQQLLDEVVNVNKALKQKTEKSHSSVGTEGRKENDGGSKSDDVHHNPQESTANSTPELSPTERQDLQNKMSKLLAMLDEVDRRYKQYYHQMQIVVSSFDVIAGSGAARPYTALALQTISRHFRCLRDAINGQIRATGKSLGEQDSSSAKGSGITRLRYIDQQVRQQRAFQQFGMMQQQHAWRPQRGLPETSVSILRAWLFEHFLHPYPKDSDKLTLARQTGLTRSQVSNWFINARVRLWKPMIEDMYKEEFGETEMDSNSSENATKGKEETRSSEDRDDLPSLKSASERCQSSQLNDSSKSVFINNVETDGVTVGFQNEVNAGESNYMNLKLGEQQPPSDNCSLLQNAMVQSDGNSRYVAYQMAELERYGNGGVSLTLGLQHCDGALPVSDVPQSFVTMRGNDIYNQAPLGAETSDYDCLNLVDRQHRFGSLHLLHDFVA
uniref:BEL1-like homeodomain protein 7 n=2 Tax=Anthurium amnicola TaxID=1678845 RepID=A0A1D1YQP0_9ARAE